MTVDLTPEPVAGNLARRTVSSSVRPDPGRGAVPGCRPAGGTGFEPVDDAVAPLAAAMLTRNLSSELP